MRKGQRNGFPLLFNGDGKVSKLEKAVPCHLKGLGIDCPGHRLTSFISHSVLEGRQGLLFFADIGLYLFHQIVHLKGFGDILIGPCFHPKGFILFLGLGGQHQDGDVFVSFVKL